MKMRPASHLCFHFYFRAPSVLVAAMRTYANSRSVLTKCLDLLLDISEAHPADSLHPLIVLSSKTNGLALYRFVIASEGVMVLIYPVNQPPAGCAVAAQLPLVPPPSIQSHASASGNN